MESGIARKHLKRYCLDFIAKDGDRFIPDYAVNVDAANHHNAVETMNNNRSTIASGIGWDTIAAKPVHGDTVVVRPVDDKVKVSRVAFQYNGEVGRWIDIANHVIYPKRDK